ncbi:MAG: UDP-N-acetylmuramoyl-L-alanyl-D-glutamate--2,6-diaminopimelate ligase [Bdellovibrionia bacterium]
MLKPQLTQLTLVQLLALLPKEILSPQDPSRQALLHGSAQVTGVTSDSREVKPGSVFVAICGGTQDGHQFIDLALEKGAVFVVGEQPMPSSQLKGVYLQVSDSREALAALAAQFFHHPSDGLLVLGVTGTSGKTTTTFILESILAAAGHRVGIIGTIHFRVGNQVLPSTHTTPGAAELQGLLAEMKNAGCTAVVMEVSSHALKQKRVASVAFDGVVFTNLSPEHLDFHPDLEDYFQSKALLFTECMKFSQSRGKKPVMAINSEDEHGHRLLRTLAAPHSAFLPQHALQVSPSGISGQLGPVKVESSFTGQFNGSNLSAAVTLALALQISIPCIERGIRDLKGVPGRLERVPNARDIHVWVDYAHKPDALEKVLKTLSLLRGGNRLITVFGCGGDRDRKKRPLMGRIAAENSDWVFVTSDNPRTEDPQAIMDEILAGMTGHSHVSVEVDRKTAILKAACLARPGDLVVIAGKGHETYQIMGTTRVHFDDREVAAWAFEQKEPTQG